MRTIRVRQPPREGQLEEEPRATVPGLQAVGLPYLETNEGELLFTNEGKLLELT